MRPSPLGYDGRSSMPFWSWSLGVAPFDGFGGFELCPLVESPRPPRRRHETTVLLTTTFNRFHTLADGIGGVVLSLLVLSGGPIVAPAWLPVA